MSPRHGAKDAAAICDALGIPPNCATRVEMVWDVGDALRAHVELVADGAAMPLIIERLDASAAVLEVRVKPLDVRAWIEATTWSRRISLWKHRRAYALRQFMTGGAE